MAGLMEEIAGVKQTLGVDDEASRLDHDARQERAGVERCEANGEADLRIAVGSSIDLEFNV
jgi:hypothetical protein